MTCQWHETLLAAPSRQSRFVGSSKHTTNKHNGSIFLSGARSRRPLNLLASSGGRQSEKKERPNVHSPVTDTRAC